MLQTSDDRDRGWYIPGIHRRNHGSHVIYAMMMTSHCTKHRRYIQHNLQSLTSHKDLYNFWVHSVTVHVPCSVVTPSANSALWELCGFCFVCSNYSSTYCSTSGIAWLLFCVLCNIPPWRYIQVYMLNIPPVLCSVTSSSWYIQM